MSQLFVKRQKMAKGNVVFHETLIFALCDVPSLIEKTISVAGDQIQEPMSQKTFSVA